MIIPVIKTFRGLCGLTSFIDAMHLGLPVIISSNTSLGIDVEKEKIGLCYESGNLKSLSHAMNTLVNNTDLYHEYSKNCFLYAAQYDYHTFAHNLLFLLKSL
jgi:glycosyltransferase involved in cell wall biosynthesis